MAHGFTKDVAETEINRGLGIFRSRRSFVTMPLKQDGGTAHLAQGSVHVILRGTDASDAWERTIERYKHKCAQCGSGIMLELDHIHGGTSGRCWCDENLRMLCKNPCHTRRHQKRVRTP